MVEVTDSAQEKLAEYLDQNNITSSLRVMMMQGGCSGPALGLALDEKKDDDEVTSLAKVTVLIDKELLNQCGNIVVDFVDAGSRSGFSISSENPLPGGGGCSSGSCGSSGCGC